MAKFTSSLFIPTAGSTSQVEEVGITPATGFQDLKIRSLGVGAAATGTSGTVTVTTIQAPAATALSLGGGASTQVSIATTGATTITASATVLTVNATSASTVGVLVQSSGVNTGAIYSFANDLNGATAEIVAIDPTTMATGVGGGIGFIGFTVGTSQSTTFAAVRGAKENSTGGDGHGYIGLYTNTFPGSTTLVEQWRVTSAAHLFGTSTSTIGWTSGVAGSTADAGLSRISSGVVAVGAGTNGSVTGTIQAALHQDTNGNLRCQSATLAQNATNGFLIAPSVLTGAPTGVPALGNGALAVGGDAQLYVYLGGWSKVSNQAAGATPTLSQVLAAGNTTGGNDIDLNADGSHGVTGNRINFNGSSFIYRVSTVATTNITLDGQCQFTSSATGTTTAALGTSNSPATVGTAPYVWIKASAPDNTTVYIPAWK